MKRVFAVAAAAVLFQTVALQVTPAKIKHHNNAIAGQYMVVLAGRVADKAYDGVVGSLSAAYGFSVRTQWRERVQGFVCTGLRAASSTGTPVYSVSTPESWLCQSNSGLSFATYLSNPGTCPTGYHGASGSSTPVHFNATNNESGAGMVYSNMSCP